MVLRKFPKAEQKIRKFIVEKIFEIWKLLLFNGLFEANYVFGTLTRCCSRESIENDSLCLKVNLARAFQWPDFL